MKRFLDCFISLLLLTVAFPLFLLISMLIFLSNPQASIVYRHKRVGHLGKPFFCYKFRTMHPESDSRLHAFFFQNPNAEEEWKNTRKLTHDPRITAIGKWLRKTSLDELPQLWNVLKGDLSLVGPRPVMEEEVTTYFQTKADKILSVKPGITGFWQVYGREKGCYLERVRMEEYYVENHSIKMDCLLLLKTIPIVLKAKGGR